MKSLLVGVLAAALSAGFASDALAGAVVPAVPAVPKSIDIEDPPIFPLSEVKRGQKGNGFTVFASARGPEPFGFEVLGVMKSYLGPGEDLIIARLVGEQIERTGVISGMSGSPAYIDGKLVGAVGYRFGSFTKDAIAGITPIERMMASVSGKGGSARGRGRSALAETPWGKATPIGVPLVASGLSPEVIAAFNPEFIKRGYGPLVPAGGLAQGKRSTKAGMGRFFASGPIAGVLVDGDLFMAGIGTVTWVKGNRFLAFGHPFLSTGVSQMPVSDAYIVTTVASEAGSWKMGQASVPVGQLTDDRLHAIGGVMGTRPDTFPVDVELDLGGPRVGSDARKKLHFDVFRHPTDTPLFAAIALANALQSRIGVEMSGTLDVAGQVAFTDASGKRYALPLAMRSVADGGQVEIGAALMLLGELSALKGNGFSEVTLRKLNLKVTRRSDIDALTLEKITVQSSAIRGRKLDVELELMPYERAPITWRRTLAIPKGIAPGKYKVVAVAPGGAARIEAKSGRIGEVDDLASLILARAAKPPDGTISFYLVKAGTSFSVAGVPVGQVPASIVGLLEDGAQLKKFDTWSRRLLVERTKSATFGKTSVSVHIAKERQ